MVLAISIWLKTKKLVGRTESESLNVWKLVLYWFYIHVVWIKERERASCLGLIICCPPVAVEFLATLTPETTGFGKIGIRLSDWS